MRRKRRIQSCKISMMKRRPSTIIVLVVITQTKQLTKILSFSIRKNSLTPIRIPEMVVAFRLMRFQE